ncbi:MAG: hypothetical protein IKC03_02450 [Oscillospiraceae bacterium]|nr:hypothetical protein [Oscillospiraceae bacterium]
MNLKDAFRFQNKLQRIIDEAQATLNQDQNITKVENTYRRKKVWAEAEDETTVETPATEYADHITEMVEFLMYLLLEKETLCAAIRTAKSTLPVDIDSEVNLNGTRQSIASTLRYMNTLRSREVIVANGGTGFRFNAEGNQVSYRCDVKRVTTINFDRNTVKKCLAELNRKSDAVSNEVDRCLVITEVAYDSPFDVNDSFAEVFEHYLER